MAAVPPPEVLWEDPHGLAVNKPAGLLTQPGSDPGEPTLLDWVRDHLRRAGMGDAPYVGTVHRLDRPVSGVILWGKTAKATRRWAEQFRLRSVRKEYWALVEGTVGPPGSRGTWLDAIGPPGRDGRAAIAPAGEPGFAAARTEFEVAAASGTPDGWTRLILRPETGRTHQLRAQAAARGWPILGDRTYDSARPFPAGIALHARSLVADHPIRLAAMTWTAPPPPAWDGWVAEA